MYKHAFVGHIATPTVGAIATPMVGAIHTPMVGAIHTPEVGAIHTPEVGPVETAYLVNLEGSMFHANGGAIASGAQAAALGGLKGIIALQQQYNVVPGVGTPYLMNEPFVGTVMGTVPY